MPQSLNISELTDQLGSNNPAIAEITLKIAKQIGTPIVLKNTTAYKRLLFLFEGNADTKNVIMYCPVIKSSITNYTMQRHPESNVSTKTVKLIQAV